MEEKKFVPKLRFSGFDDEWHCKNIKDIGKIISGGTPKTTVEEYWNGEINWFTPSELNNQKYLYESERKITPKGLNNSSAKLLPINSILISSRATVGEVAMNKTESTTNQDFETIIPNKEMYNDFIYYSIIHLKSELLKMSYGSTFLSITKTDLGKIKLNYPQFNEQKKISDFLNQIDNKIQLLKEKHENYQSFKKYLMQQIFAQKLRFDFDSEWISVKLKDIAKITGGKRMPKGSSLINEPNNHPYITVSNMNNNFEDLSTYQYVPTEIYPQIKNYIVDYNDLIISVAGTLGLVKKVPKCLNKANLTENANRISEIQINIDYLQYFLNTTQIQNRILAVQTNNAQPKLALKEIRNFKIEYPPTEEQEKIVNFISNVDKKINLIDNNLMNIQNFKKGLLQQMFV